MDEKTKIQGIRSTIPEPAFNSPITELEIPPSVHNLLEGNGYKNVGDLILQMGIDDKQILAIRGIGPKIFEQIGVAIKQYETPKEAKVVKSPTYLPPVPSLADYYKPPLGNMVSSKDEDVEADEPADAAPSYSPPVPSLADYFDPDSVITSVNPMKASANEVTKQQKPPRKKKSKKNKTDQKVLKDKKAKKKKNKKKSTKPKVKKKKSKKKAKRKKKK
ncbi:hypothetical protein H8E77_28925 [bacterium]|nr:hypothetical protein [bacterium]